MLIVLALLFFLLTPGIVLSFPPRSSRNVVAATHALIFALIWGIIHKPLWRSLSGFSY
jgi:hypothetical protein